MLYRGRVVPGFGLGAVQNIPQCGVVSKCDRVTLPGGHRYVIGFAQQYGEQPAFPLSPQLEEMIRRSSPLSDYMDPIDWVVATAPADNLGVVSPQAPWALPIAVAGYVKQDWMLIDSATQTWLIAAMVPDGAPLPSPGPPSVPAQPNSQPQASSGSSTAVIVLGGVALAALVAAVFGARV